VTGGSFCRNWNGLRVGDVFDRMQGTIAEGAGGQADQAAGRGRDWHTYWRFNKVPNGKAELQKKVEF